MKSKQFIISMALLGVILIASAGGLLFKPSQYEGLMVVVEYDGKNVLEIPLNGEPATFTVKGENMEQLDENGEPILNEDGSTKTANVATLVRDENGVKFVDSKCPDHLCEQYGYINKVGESAICMPALLSATVVEE